MPKTLETPAENRAFMDGWVEATRASGLDWAKARVEMERVADEVRAVIGRKDGEILKLRGKLRQQKEAYEAKIISLESELEAWKLAWKHRGEAE